MLAENLPDRILLYILCCPLTLVNTNFPTFYDTTGSGRENKYVRALDVARCEENIIWNTHQ